ncbi:MAG: phosphate transporter substrate-binding protein [Novosphingobium sp.]|nr:phosphate transporter substrate-binding protein [Novosphingobium sp.]
MYDLPWLRSANDDLWKILSDRLRARGVDDVPVSMQRGGDLIAMWTSPALLFGQTCGYPLMTRLGHGVQVVATPHYLAEGCEGPFHRAAIVVRRDDPARSLTDLRSRRAGVNGRDSNTGMNLFRAVIAQIADGPKFFGSVAVTGSHGRSLAAVISGRIDVASIDAVTLSLFRDRCPDRARELRILAWTPSVPSLPFITSTESSETLVIALRDDLDAVLGEGIAPQSLRIAGVSLLDRGDYETVVTLERQAIELGYPSLQ